MTDLQNAGIGEIFRRLLVQEFFSKLPSLNFHIGQGIRRLRRRAKGGQQD